MKEKEKEIGLSEAIRIMEQLLGKRAWNPCLGYGTSFTLEFGNEIEDKDHIRGEWHLWLYYCCWRIEDVNGIILIGCEDDRKAIKKKLKSLEFLEVDRFEMSRAKDITIKFKTGLVIRTFSAVGVDPDDEHWTLFMPNNEVLESRPGVGFLLSSSCES